MEQEESPSDGGGTVEEETQESRFRQETTPTTSLVSRMLGSDGTLIDVGAGTGRSCLPYARAGHRVTAVEKNPGMAAGLQEEVNAEGLEVEVLVGPWPEAAARAPVADVVLSSHVGVRRTEIAPFITGLAGTAAAGWWWR